MNYVPPHLRTVAVTLEEPKKTFTETCDTIEVTTNTPYGTLESLKTLNTSKNLPYTTPTVIQKYAIPAVLKGHPVQCRAPTGMGKTMCFLIPLIETMKVGNGPKVCIISPTRELCEQIKEEGLKINPRLSIECLYGGAYSGRFNPNANIVVAAPGKLLHYLGEKRINFSQLTGFVLDEADKLLEMGFEQDIRTIKGFIPATTSVYLFSATFPKNLTPIINDFLPKNKVLIEIQKETLTNIKQVLIKIKNKDEKLKEMLDKAYSGEDKPKILVFAEKKITVQNLEQRIAGWGFPCSSLHGDKEQPERQLALNQYKTGKVPVLVATSVAARGIDVKDILMVINYDFPRDVKEYIHRIGRTGRQGKEGTAVTFMDSSDLHNSAVNAELIEILKESKSEVPDFLLSEGFRRDREVVSKPWKSGARKTEVNSRTSSTVEVKGLLKRMTISQESDSKNDLTTSTDQLSYLSTEKDDTDDDMAGGW